MRAQFWSVAANAGVPDARTEVSPASTSRVPFTFANSRGRPRLWLALGGLFLSLYLLTMGGHLDSPDEELMFQVTRSMAEHGTMNIGETGLAEQLTQTGANGQTFVPYSPVASAMSVPFYLAAKP